MGNRAVITFDSNPKDSSLGIYLHWNGGPDSVIAFLDAMEHFNIRRPNTDCYGIARLVQIIGNWFGGGLSLGIDTLKNLDTDNGDNGLYIVTYKDIGSSTRCVIDRGIRQILHPTKQYTGTSLILNQDDIRLKSKYWNPEEGKGILEQVIEANKVHFDNKD